MKNEKIFANELMTDEQLNQVNGGGLSGGKVKNWIQVAKVVTKIIIKAVKDYKKTS